MSDEENNGAVREREEAGRINTRFIGKPSGFLMLINMFVAFVAMCMMSGWLGDTRYRSGRWNFFMYSCIHTWLGLLIIFILRLIKVPTHCAVINWNITFLINTIVMVVLLLISSSVVIKKAVDFRRICGYADCELLTATAIFGYFAMIGCAVESFFHFKDFKES